MIHNITLKFKTREIETEYIEDQRDSTIKGFQIFTIFAEVHFILRIIYTITIETQMEVYLIYPFFSAYLPLHYYLLRRSSPQYLKFLILMQQGTEFIAATVVQAITWSCLLILGDFNPVAKAQLVFNFLILITFRYFFEKGKRLQFIMQFQNRKWTQIIEDILPAWVVIIKFDRYQNIVLKTKNKLFCKEFDIKFNENDDMKFRKLIRNMEVYKEDDFPQMDKFTDKEKKDSGKNFEKRIISILQSTNTSELINQQVSCSSSFYSFEGETFIAIKRDEQHVKLLKISLVKFYTEEPLVMLLFEEKSQTKLEEFQKEIDWRDNFYCKFLEKSMKCSSSIIGFLKINHLIVSKYLKKKLDKQKQFFELMDQQIIKAYIGHNIMLNAKTMTDISQRRLQYSISTFNIATLIQKLVQNFRLSAIQCTKIEQPKLKQQKSFLKRATERKLTQKNQNVIKNDIQKISQVIISVLEFVILMLQIGNNNMENLSENIQLQMKIPKKLQQVISIGLYHPHLKIPMSVVQLLTKNWAQSEANTSRCIMKLQTQIVGQIQSKIDEVVENADQSLYSFTEKDNNSRRQDILKENTFQTNIALAQYLISQIGPNNIFLIKNKEKKKLHKEKDISEKLEQDFNKISFQVYMDLTEEIDKIQEQSEKKMGAYDESLNVPSFSPIKNNLGRTLNQSSTIRLLDSKQSNSPNLQLQKFEI